MYTSQETSVISIVEQTTNGLPVTTIIREIMMLRSNVTYVERVLLRFASSSLYCAVSLACFIQSQYTRMFTAKGKSAHDTPLLSEIKAAVNTGKQYANVKRYKYKFFLFTLPPNCQRIFITPDSTL